LGAFIRTLALSLLRSNLTESMGDRTERLGLAALLFGASLMLAISTMAVLLAALWIWLTRHMASDSAALIIGCILLAATIGMAFWAKYLLHSHPKRTISNPTNLPIPEWALELFAMVKPHLSEAVIASLIAGWAAGRSRKD
jgi:hypothetical protein